MQPFAPRTYGKAGPEAKIQNDVIDTLKKGDWFVQVMHGNLFQYGVPDLFIAHLKFGQRWVEVKNPLAFSFTKAQLDNFPKMHAAGVGIWILFSAEPSELQKLFRPANWLEIYLKWVTNANGKR